MFSLSRRSLDNLSGVDLRLQMVVKDAILITTVDFGVIEGVRNIERQKELVASGASQTLNSKHLPQKSGYGHAVDLMAYLGDQGRWEVIFYDNIAEAIRKSAIKYDVPIRWGGCWIVKDIREWRQPMSEAIIHYIDTRRKQGRKPFLDLPHFEISS